MVSNSKNEPGRSSDQENLLFDAVVLAVGHSARDVYNMLLQHNIEMVPKNFAVAYCICVYLSQLILKYEDVVLLYASIKKIISI